MGVNPYLRAKIEERASKSAMLQTIQDKAAQENRDLDETEGKTFEEIVKRLNDLDSDINRIKSFDESAAKFADLVGAQSQAAERADLAYRKADRQEPSIETRQAIDYGKQFVESAAFKGYPGHGTSARLTLPGPHSPEFRSAISLGSLVTSDGVPLNGYQSWAGPAGPQFPNAFLSVIGRVATNQNAIMYIHWEPNPPGDAADVAEGELKPEMVMSPIEDTALLKTVAHYKAVTRQALEDYPQIQSIIQDRLLRGVQSKLEHDAVAALTADLNIEAIPGDDLQIAIRLAIATAESNGYSPNAIVLNPLDAAELDLARMAATVNGPVRGNDWWGLPTIPIMTVPAGQAYVGDFKMGETWFDRGTTDVYMSDSHADFFLRNQLVILAEARAAFKVTEPGAILKATGPVTP